MAYLSSLSGATTTITGYVTPAAANTGIRIGGACSVSVLNHLIMTFTATKTSISFCLPSVYGLAPTSSSNLYALLASAGVTCTASPQSASGDGEYIHTEGYYGTNIIVGLSTNSNNFVLIGTNSKGTWYSTQVECSAVSISYSISGM